MNLTPEQIRIIESKPSGHNLIKGVAGSGKTTVAISKIPNLINHYLEDGQKVLIVTYNKTLIQYVEHTYNKLKLNDTIFFPDNSGERLVIKTMDQIINSMYYKIQRIKNKINSKRSIISNSKSRKILELAICQIQKNYSMDSIVNTNNMDFLIAELDFIKSCKYTDREVYLNVDRVGRFSKNEENSKYILHKNSASRNAIFDLFECYERLIYNEGFIDFKTMALLVLKAIKNETIKPDKYTHIIVDESQDLTKVQLEILHELYNKELSNGSITFIADTAQSIYEHSWLSNHSFKSIGFDMSGRSKVLSRNHRTTMEIAMASYSMLEKDEEVTANENYVKPQAIEKHGDMPLYMHFSNEKSEFSYIENLIKGLCKSYYLHDIAILARTKPQLELLHTHLIENGISANMFNKNEQSFEDDKVHLMTLHSIKGLEFPVIIIMGINQGYLPYDNGKINIDAHYESIERKLLYVGMTRAKESLYLTSSVKESKFIHEINPALLRDSDTQFSPFKKIGISDYLFVEKIKAKNPKRDIYGYEEMVRQWYINELITKLSYPLEIIDVEYEVQNYSRSGFVDIVVFGFLDVKYPMAFIEVKRRGEDLKFAMTQLEQYLGSHQSVKYGVVTNGDEIITVEKFKNGFRRGAQLPRYFVNLANRYCEFSYYDLKSRNEYLIKVNEEDNDEITIKNKNSDGAISYKSLVDIPIYGEVAAGLMQTPYEDNIDISRIPSDFLYDEKNCFGLKITGNSMIEAGIDEGDYVIIHRQSTANRRDIVIAGSKKDNEVTIKRLEISGNLALLLPENSEYEPIPIPINDLFINGIVVGVLKK